jgi:hypothetical protein
MIEPLFQLSTEDNDGWFLCFGRDGDGKDYSIVTRHVHASEAGAILRGAKLDAETVLKILNDHYEEYVTKDIG